MPGQTLLRPEAEWIKLPDQTTPSIVSAHLWEAAQERLKRNLDQSAKPSLRADLLAGFIFCAVCGQRLLGGNEHGGYRVYRCRSRSTPRGPCGGKRVPASVCENSIWQEILDTLSDHQRLSLELEKLKREHEDLRSQLQTDLDCARGEYNRFSDLHTKLLRRLLDDQSDELASIIETEIIITRQDKARFQRVIREIESLIACENEKHSSLAALSEDDRNSDSAAFSFEQKRLLLKVLEVRIVGNGRDWRLEMNA